MRTNTGPAALALTAVLALALALALGLAGCASGDSTTGEAIPADSSVAAGAGAAGPDSSPAVDGPAPGEQTVDRGRHAGKPQAEVVARFYEQLWTSYRRGSMSPAVATLTTPTALEIFRGNLQDMRDKGQTVDNLLSARVTTVKGAEVTMCLASSSYQRLEARTGAPVGAPDPGFTEYVVRLAKGTEGWKVHEINGFKDSLCGARS
jgi:hypothetical protein